MKERINIFFILASLLLFVSCVDQACYEDTDPLMNVSLYASGTGASQTASALIISTIPSADTIINTTSATSFSVPLNPVQESISIVIEIDQVADTAVISYSNFPHMVSSECGYTIFSDIEGLTTTHHLIDSLFIDNKSVNLDGQRNLRLFY